MITDKYKYVSMDAVKEILRQVELDRERDVIFLPYVVEIPKWIPVTERLPGNTGSVLITKRVLVDVTVVDIGCYFESDKTWYTNDFAVADVVAWMPVPEPFKGSE